MADTGIQIKVDFSNAAERQRQLKAIIGKQVVRVVNETSLELQKYIKTQRFGPEPNSTTATTLTSHHGASGLKGSVAPVPAEIDGDIVRGGISIGKKYASVHFGKAGKVTVIRAKNKPYLKFPIMGKKGEWAQVKEVRIPVRISTESLIEFTKPILGKGLKTVKENISKSLGGSK